MRLAGVAHQILKSGKTTMSFSTINISGNDALRILNERRAEYSRTGEYPFLVGDEEERERLVENSEFNEQDPAEIILLSYEVDLKVWTEVRGQELEDDEMPLDVVIGEWPDEEIEPGMVTAHLDITSGSPKSNVVLGLVKIQEPWHLPAAMKYGGWNDCPHSDVHCAIHRYWQERYGAEIVSMTGDVIECAVKNPPATKEEAMELARQQYFYCTDIVDQGCESISNLAATLINSPFWYFWWD